MAENVRLPFFDVDVDNVSEHEDFPKNLIFNLAD